MFVYFFLAGKLTLSQSHALFPRNTPKTGAKFSVLALLTVISLWMPPIDFHLLADPLPANRRIDWSQAGVIGGIPNNYTQFCNVKVSIPGSTLVARGDGSTPDDAALQAAINNAPNYSYIYIPAGVYALTNGVIIGSPGTTAKHIMLLGTNSGPTNLTWFAGIGTGHAYNLVSIQQYTIGVSNAVTDLSAMTNGQGFATFASTSGMLSNYFAVSSTSLIAAGYIGQGCNEVASYLHNWRQIVQVTNVSGNTAYFTPPLRYDLTNSSVVYFWETSDFANSPNFCGIGNIGMTFSNEAATVSDLLFLRGVNNCWVTNCNLHKLVNAGVELTECSHCTIEGCAIDHGWDYVGGWAYGLWDFDVGTDNLFCNNIGYDLRHFYASEGYVSGDVVSYNYETNELFRSVNNTPAGAAMSGSYITHALGAKYILFEGNVGDVYSADNVLGESQDTTFFRDRAIPVDHSDDYPSGITDQNESGAIAMCIETNNAYCSVIGCYLGWPGASITYWDTPQTGPGNYAGDIFAVGWCESGGYTWSGTNISQSTLLRAVNYDTVTGTTRTDVGLDTNLPNSYYLSSEPSWWGSGPWPAIGPDLTPMASPIPAQLRYYQVQPSGTETVSPPFNLKVVVSGG